MQRVIGEEGLEPNPGDASIYLEIVRILESTGESGGCFGQISTKTASAIESLFELYAASNLDSQARIIVGLESLNEGLVTGLTGLVESEIVINRQIVK